MAEAITRLVVDCSVVVKWKIPTEDHAAAAEALFVDWEHQVVDVSVPNHFPSEVISAFLRACRRDRITADENCLTPGGLLPSLSQRRVCR